MGINNVTGDLIGALRGCSLSGTREGSSIRIFQVSTLGFALVPHGARLDDAADDDRSDVVLDEPLPASARIKKKPQMMAKTIATAIHTPALPLFLGVCGAWGAWYCPAGTGKP